MHGDLRRVQRARLFVDFLCESLLERPADFIGIRLNNRRAQMDTSVVVTVSMATDVKADFRIVAVLVALISEGSDAGPDSRIRLIPRFSR